MQTLCYSVADMDCFCSCKFVLVCLFVLLFVTDAFVSAEMIVVVSLHFSSMAICSSKMLFKLIYIVHTKL